MKLKCVQHDRRVLTIPGSPIFHHRTGDMSTCDSKTAVMRDNMSRTTRQFAIRNAELVQTLTHKEH